MQVGLVSIPVKPQMLAVLLVGGLLTLVPSAAAGTDECAAGTDAPSTPTGAPALLVPSSCDGHVGLGSDLADVYRLVHADPIKANLGSTSLNFCLTSNDHFSGAYFSVSYNEGPFYNDPGAGVWSDRILESGCVSGSVTRPTFALPGGIWYLTVRLTGWVGADVSYTVGVS